MAVQSYFKCPCGDVYICWVAKKRWQKLKKELLHKYRVVLVDTQTFAERFSFTLSGFNVFLAAGSASVGLVALTIFLIAYTPLREYIPGYASTQLRRDALRLSTQIDSLESVVAFHEVQWSTIDRILSNKPLSDSIAPQAPAASADPKKLLPGKSEKTFREKQEELDQYRLTTKPSVQVLGGFISPVTGSLLQSYAPTKGHLGVDWSVPEGTTVKCALDGTVIQSDWSPEWGHFLWVQHAQNALTFYGQNAQVLKRRGAKVRAGEAIAISGKGLQEKVPSVHFELWLKGQPVNPVVYLP
jgi:murein DD-endopeptidase MepM/ murein hydrolase activator NlpD